MPVCRSAVCVFRRGRDDESGGGSARDGLSGVVGEPSVLFIEVFAEGGGEGVEQLLGFSLVQRERVVDGGQDALEGSE